MLLCGLVLWCCLTHGRMPCPQQSDSPCPFMARQYLNSVACDTNTAESCHALWHSLICHSSEILQMPLSQVSGLRVFCCVTSCCHICTAAAKSVVAVQVSHPVHSLKTGCILTSARRSALAASWPQWLMASWNPWWRTG